MPVLPHYRRRTLSLIPILAILLTGFFGCDREQNGASTTTDFDFGDCPVLAPDDVRTGATLPEDSCYRVVEELVVEEGTLTMETGVALGFVPEVQPTGGHTFPTLEIRDSGKIQAVGSEDKPILFLSTEKPDSQRVFEDEYEMARIRLIGTDAENRLESIVLDHGHIAVHSSSLVVQDSELRNNAECLYSSYFRMGPSPSTVVLDNNILDCGSTPVRLELEDVTGLRATNSFANEEAAVIAINLSAGGRDYERDFVIPDAGIPYRLGTPDQGHGVIVAANLTIEPGVEMQFQNQTRLVVGALQQDGTVRGELTADGTAEAPIVLTSVPSNDGWVGIQIEGGENTLRHVVLENVHDQYGMGALNNDATALFVRGMYHTSPAPSVLVEDTTIRNSRKGIYVRRGSVLSCSGLTFEGIEEEEIDGADPESTDICGGNF